MPDALTQVKRQISAGVAAFEANDRDGALACFQQALDTLEAVEDKTAQRDQFARLGTGFIHLGAPDRALLAAQAAVALDQELGDRNFEGQDILLCGTAYAGLGNLQAALSAYRDARDIFVQDENWANAASANTNIAIYVGQQDLDQAIDLLEQSLTYLTRQAFPDTEITTRIALIQALVVAERPEKRVFEVARVLFDNFLEQLRPDQKENSIGPLEQAIERYFKQHPQPDPAAWKAKQFPTLYG